MAQRYFLGLLVLALLYPTSATVTTAALKDLYRELNYPQFLYTEPWKGISVHSSVIFIQLNGPDLIGHLGNQFINLVHLKLDCSFNDFSGNIPYSLTLMKYLHHWDLTVNTFTWDLPTSVDLTVNTFSWDLPTSVELFEHQQQPEADEQQQPDKGDLWAVERDQGDGEGSDQGAGESGDQGDGEGGGEGGDQGDREGGDQGDGEGGGEGGDQGDGEGGGEGGDQGDGEGGGEAGDQGAGEGGDQGDGEGAGAADNEDNTWYRDHVSNSRRDGRWETNH